MSFGLLEKEIPSGKTVVVPDSLREWLGKRAKGKKRFTTTNPATGDFLAELPLAEKPQVDEAVKEAKAAFESGVWSQIPVLNRSRVLHQIADKIDAHRAPLAILESLDTGKPIRESFDGDIPRAALNFRFFADFALSQQGMAFQQPGAFHYADREPVGVAALITPWNLPLYLETWKIAPCLVMGNSCVLKPSELTPLTASYLQELIAQTELPKGVFQLVQGFGEGSTGAFLTEHPEIDAISFTGETTTGKAIMKVASDNLTKVSFELGGKGALVVFEDASFEAAIEVATRAAFRNQGEICLACPRILIHEKRYAEFVERFKKRVAQIKVGDPLNYETEMGALISESHLEKVTGFLRDLNPNSILLGGERPSHCPHGNYLQPTLVEGVPQESPVTQQEIFGPVASLSPFQDEAHAIQQVNATRYGLSASLWTRDLDRAHRVAKAIKKGMVWVNCWFLRDLRVPFGGQKESGIGREGGRFSLDFFSEWKSISTQLDA